MKSNMTKMLTLGAAAVAAFVAVYAIFAVDEGMVQEALSIICLIPLALYAKNYGIKPGITAMAASIALSALLVQPTVFITYTVPSAIIGTIYGICLRRFSTIPAVAILSGLCVLRLVYELLMSSFFSDINIAEEYSEIIGIVTGFFTKDGSSALGLLIHDMVLFSIPVIFVMGAVAKAAIAHVIMCIILYRIFREKQVIVLPRLNGTDIPATVLYLVLFLASIILCVLLLSGAIGYSFVIALTVDLTIVYMYLYLMYCFRHFKKKRSNYLMTLLMVIVFPITDLIYAVGFLIGVCRGEKTQHEQ